MKTASFKSLDQMEIIGFESIDGVLWARLSLRDKSSTDGINHGFNNIQIPVNPRPLQLSARGNILVDQSTKETDTVAATYS
ncbi:hypothetical protein SAMN05216327_101212 [Dyadobacter sp. SG02]|uniref:hypothetical protein n=1 Tax=Dyadobacter sp. SG02 TaxID=1855291 RepID=UPI0008ADDE90|nr:hypothetical protein [Dyadobacter sp. SG02]SEI39612.1 hypothetical protein SAMN05216327_101212 [Dyadobacter sp. SG02]